MKFIQFIILPGKYETKKEKERWNSSSGRLRWMFSDVIMKLLCDRHDKYSLIWFLNCVLCHFLVLDGIFIFLLLSVGQQRLKLHSRLNELNIREFVKFVFNLTFRSVHDFNFLVKTSYIWNYILDISSETIAPTN